MKPRPSRSVAGVLSFSDLCRTSNRGEIPRQARNDGGGGESKDETATLDGFVLPWKMYTVLSGLARFSSKGWLDGVDCCRDHGGVGSEHRIPGCRCLPRGFPRIERGRVGARNCRRGYGS